MIDKKYFRFLILTISAVLFCISLHFSASADTYYNNDGYLVAEGSSYNIAWDYTLSYPNDIPVVDSSVVIPSGYVLFGTAVYTYSSNTVRKIWIYYPADSTAPRLYNTSTSGYNYQLNCVGLGYQFFTISNNVNSSGVYSFGSTSDTTTLQSGSYKFTFFYPIQDENGNIIRPENQVNFVLNTAFVGDTFKFNCVINSGDAESVQYYMFPSSAPISGGSTSSIVPLTPQNELTVQEKENFLLRGFKTITYGLDDLIIDLNSPKASLSVTSSSRASNIFNPDSYNLSYEFLGSGRLFPSGDSSITPSGSISIKDILGNHTGVYSYQNLKLVAVCTYENRSFIATFDFNPSALNGGSPVAPSTLEPSVSYPTFSNAQSDFKELADYLKNLYETQNINDKRNMNNLLAMLNNFPWSAKLAPAFKAGFESSLPELSDELDTIFGGLFEDYTKPSEGDIQDLVDDITEERENISEKFIWVDDVKIEIYYISDSILNAGNTPPDFYVMIPANTFWRIDTPFVLTLLDCSRIPLNVVTQIKNLITVFLTLSLVLYIWRTLPSTIGNIPKGD